MLQTKNTTICWTAATFSATDGDTLESASRIVIIKVAHVLMSSARESFTLAESVIKPCVYIVAREVHGGSNGCDQWRSKEICSGGSVTDVFLTVEHWSKAPVKILASLFRDDHGFFGLILAALLAVTEVKKLPLSDIPCKGDAARPTTKGGNRTIVSPEVFKNMFSC